MAISILSGADVFLFVANSGTTAGSTAISGYTVVGCATTANLDVQTETASVTCKGMAGWDESTVGNKSWSMTCDTVYRIITGSDIGANYGADQWYDTLNARIPIYISIGSTKSGASIWFGQAWITSYKMSSNTKDATTVNITLKGTGALTKVVNP